MFLPTTKTRRPTGCGKSRAVESEENQKQVFLPSPRPWKSRKTRGIPTFPTAPTAAGISQTRSGNLIVADRKECLTPDKRLPVTQEAAGSNPVAPASLEQMRSSWHHGPRRTSARVISPCASASDTNANSDGSGFEY